MLFFAFGGHAAREEEVFADFTSNDHERVLHFKINEERTKRGLGPLALSQDISALARYYSVVMARNRAISHEDPTGLGPADRIARLGVSFGAFAENVAYHASAAEAHAALMGSYHHAMNILGPEFTEAGIGAVEDENGDIYVTELFLRRLPSTDLHQALEEVWASMQALRLRANAPVFIRDFDLSNRLAEARAQAGSGAKIRSLPSLPATALAAMHYVQTSLDFPLDYHSYVQTLQFTHAAAALSIGKSPQKANFYEVDVVLYAAPRRDKSG